VSDQGFQRVEEDAQLELSGGRLPTARSIRAELRTQLNGAVLAERNRRGEVHQPEDTWGMQRSLASVIEVCGEYSRAFADAAKEARQIAEEELIEAVGEQDGTPNQGMTVPDAEGDVKISLDTRNGYEIATDALYSAVAFAQLLGGDLVNSVVASVSTEFETPEIGKETEGILAEAMARAMAELCTLGKFEPQVSKVRVFAKELAREPGGDGVSATVTSAIKKTTQYRGVKIERTEPK
jgi:hypothetical protein